MTLATEPTNPQDPGTAGGAISIQNVTKRYNPDDTELALDGVSVEVKSGEFVSIVGRSGCGKTTLLRMVAGFHMPTTGEVLVENAPVTGPGPDRGMVFQSAALFPWLSARKNVTFGPRVQHVSAAEANAHADELLELVGITQAAERYPHELSGGMAQRVAIARALATDPSMLLMDEPFGALDELTREAMQEELLRIWKASNKTVLFVTHSIAEAIYLSDRVIVMTPHPGQVRADITIDLERPRERTSREFAEIEREIHHAIF
ncbi:MAG: ABC transporter ATP-binding protein [Beutenbergiaceae bacterium]